MEINEAARIMGRKGGLANKGNNLSFETRSRIGKLAAAARWSKPPRTEMAGDECANKRCPCHRYRQNKMEAGEMGECSLNRPLWMVIPPGGMHLECPVHGTHFIPGRAVRW